MDRCGAASALVTGAVVAGSAALAPAAPTASPSGTFDASTGSYGDNIVVYASLA